MLPIGISGCGKELNEQFFSDCKKYGISHIEISEEYYYDFNFAKVKEMADKYGIIIWSIHLPFSTVDLLIDNSAIDKELLKKSMEIHKDVIESGTKIGVDKFIVHMGCEPYPEEEKEERLKIAKASLIELADFAEKRNALICVETLPRTCLTNCVEVMKYFTEDERIKICLDVNHGIDVLPEEAVKVFGDKIITLHISDFDFVNERHWLPGEGKINWQNVYGNLKEIGYSGPWLYEIGFKCPSTILRDRDLTLEDFVKNANEIFENKEITVISKPKPNLGFWE